MKLASPKFLLLLAVITVLGNTSCRTINKGYVYFEDDRFITEDSALLAQIDSASETKVVISPEDVLGVDIFSEDPFVRQLYGMGTGTGESDQGLTRNNPYVTGFVVDEMGYINLPVLQKRIKVEGLTVNQARDSITAATSTLIKDAYVDVRFLSFKVTLLGEVAKPGIITIGREKANLTEALSLAGDLTEFANRKRIKIIRGAPDTAAMTMHVVDITDTEGYFNSEVYNLRPNDIVYVEPLSLKRFSLVARNITFAITLLNTLLLIYFRFQQ